MVTLHSLVDFLTLYVFSHSMFREKVNEWERSVLSEIRPKIVKGKVMTGKMFLGLVVEYLRTIESGGVPTIMTSLESVISS